MLGKKAHAECQVSVPIKADPLTPRLPGWWRILVVAARLTLLRGKSKEEKHTLALCLSYLSSLTSISRLVQVPFCLKKEKKNIRKPCQLLLYFNYKKKMYCFNFLEIKRNRIAVKSNASGGFLFQIIHSVQFIYEGERLTLVMFTILLFNYV